MRDVFVLGVHMIKFGRYPEKSVPELGAESVIGALKDAGMTMKDIELLACGNLYQSNAMVGQRIMQIVGQTGAPVVNVSNACATGSPSRPTAGRTCGRWRCRRRCTHRRHRECRSPWRSVDSRAAAA